MTAPGRLRLVKGQQNAAASDEIAAANPNFAAAMPMGNAAPAAANTLSAAEAAAALGKDIRTIHRWAQRGKLGAKLMNGAFRFPREAIEEAMGNAHGQTKNAAAMPHHAAPNAAAMPMGNMATPQAQAVPLEAHLAALRMLEEAQARERAVHEDVRRLERQYLAMGFELTRYQAALEANTCSLMEREARTKEAEAHLVEARRQATEAEARARLVDEERELRIEAEAKAARAREEAQSLQVELEEEKADARELTQRVKAEQEELGEAQHLADMTCRRIEEETEARERAEAELRATRQRVEELEAQAAHLVKQEQELAEAHRRVNELEAAGKRPWWKRLFS